MASTRYTGIASMFKTPASTRKRCKKGSHKSRSKKNPRCLDNKTRYRCPKGCRRISKKK